VIDRKRVARFVTLALAAVFVLVFGFQFYRIGMKNLTYYRDLSQARRDIAALQARRVEQLREIERLSVPAGAIPEIHSRLHFVNDHEEILYIRTPAHD
jgi:cell division protein FtsB